MNNKHYSTDWAKAKSRDLLKEMIRQHLGYRKPKELRVLSLLGIDAEEIFQVYDPLGIPRENIICVERDADIAERLRKRELGIGVECSSIEDFIERQGRIAYDVVGLDYTGPFSSEELRMLVHLADKQQRNQFLLHVANSLRRDRQNYVHYFYGHALDCEIRPEMLLIDPNARAIDITKRTLGFLSAAENRDNLVAEKQKSFTPLIVAAMRRGSAKDIDSAFAFFAGEEKRHIVEILERTIRTYTKEDIVLDPDHPLEAHERQWYLPMLQHLIESSTMICIRDECKPYDIKNPLDHGYLYQAILTMQPEGKFFRAKDIQRYSYLSETGTPMVGDISFFVYPHYEQDAAEEIAHLINYPERFSIRNFPRFVKAALAYQKILQSLWTPEERERRDDNTRVFLGNSSKPVLTRGRAIDEFLTGASVDDVKEKFRGWSNKPLSQWRAHATMGTYARKDADEEDRDLEVITKEETLDLLASGIPVEEIQAAYPTSFSLGQLRAFKAHLTMGTYEKSDGES